MLALLFAAYATYSAGWMTLSLELLGKYTGLTSLLAGYLHSLRYQRSTETQDSTNVILCPKGKSRIQV